MLETIQMVVDSGYEANADVSVVLNDPLFWEKLAEVKEIEDVRKLRASFINHINVGGELDSFFLTLGII